MQRTLKEGPELVDGVSCTAAMRALGVQDDEQGAGTAVDARDGGPCIHGSQELSLFLCRGRRAWRPSVLGPMSGVAAVSLPPTLLRQELARPVNRLFHRTGDHRAPRAGEHFLAPRADAGD